MSLARTKHTKAKARTRKIRGVVLSSTAAAAAATAGPLFCWRTRGEECGGTSRLVIRRSSSRSPTTPETGGNWKAFGPEKERSGGDGSARARAVCAPLSPSPSPHPNPLLLAPLPHTLHRPKVSSPFSQQSPIDPKPLHHHHGAALVDLVAVGRGGLARAAERRARAPGPACLLLAGRAPRLLGRRRALVGRGGLLRARQPVRPSSSSCSSTSSWPRPLRSGGA